MGQAEIVWSSGCCSQVPSAAWLAPGCIMYVCGMLPAAAGHNAFVLRQQCHHQHVHCSDVVTHVAVAACPEVQPCGCCCCLHQPPRKPVTTHCQHLYTQRTQYSTAQHSEAHHSTAWFNFIKVHPESGSCSPCGVDAGRIAQKKCICQNAGCLSPLPTGPAHFTADRPSRRCSY